MIMTLHVHVHVHIQIDIEKINNELVEFQNRCRKLPKGLKEWQAFNDLRKKIDDFNETCPLLELMSNKAMKDRHWERISTVTGENDTCTCTCTLLIMCVGHSFDVQSESFQLRHIMEAPLLQNKDDIEDICISAVKEKDIEAKLKQVRIIHVQHEVVLEINMYMYNYQFTVYTVTILWYVLGQTKPVIHVHVVHYY